VKTINSNCCLERYRYVLEITPNIQTYVIMAIFFFLNWIGISVV